jgi:hypothetical protein
MTTDKIHSIAIKGMVSAFEKSLELIPTKLSKGDVYDFDPEDWAVFYWVDRTQIGATDYCAVNSATGEFRYLGEIGE